MQLFSYRIYSSDLSSGALSLALPLANGARRIALACAVTESSPQPGDVPVALGVSIGAGIGAAVGVPLGGGFSAPGAVASSLTLGLTQNTLAELVAPGPYTLELTGDAAALAANSGNFTISVLIAVA
jgi:hypothetical protein